MVEQAEVEPKNANQRLIEQARSRWVSYVIGGEKEYQGRSEHFRAGKITQTLTCTHKHETAKAAGACAEKLGQKA